MMIGRFERFKCNFGAPGSNIPYLILDVPGLPAGFYYPQANVVNSQIRITSEVLKNVFDEQVDGLVAFVHQQIQELHEKRPEERVNYIILSGGLGSSPYVQDRLRWHFDEHNTTLSPAAKGLKILAAEEPQLAVVQGLVLERAQQISRAFDPIVSRHARVSYGVVVNLKYNPDIHRGQSFVKDPRDGKKWIPNQIEWLIRQVRAPARA
jgi:cell division ATPase FtsA